MLACNPSKRASRAVLAMDDVFKAVCLACLLSHSCWGDSGVEGPSLAEHMTLVLRHHRSSRVWQEVANVMRKVLKVCLLHARLMHTN